MKNSNADRLIRNISAMTFEFPAPSPGYGIDRVTGRGIPPEETSDEEGVEVAIQISGEFCRRIIPGDDALKIFEIVWHHLNRSESGSSQS